MVPSSDSSARTIANAPLRRDARAPPLYTARQPPLVQPRETSAFAARTAMAFGVRDLGHEWVTLFQTIGAVSGGYSRSMKLSIPDTILLSPSGLPSMWYTTSASSHIKPRNLMRVTPRSILDALTSSASPAPDDIVAVQRVGFRVEALTLRQLQDVCAEMERPRIIERRHEWDDDDASDSGEDSSDARTCEQRTPFCLQRFVPRDRDVTFLVLWRCKHRSSGVPVRDNVTHKQYARSFYKRPLPLLTSDILSKCDLFLYERSRGDASDPGRAMRERDGDDDDERSATEQLPRDVITHLDLESATLFDDTLAAHGFADDVIVPQLYYMKLAASEILNRLNRGLQTRQAAGLLCEFFVGAHDKRVYFAGLCGTHWEHSEPSWETLAGVDVTSRAVSAFLDKRRCARRSSVQQPHDSPSPKRPGASPSGGSADERASGSSQLTAAEQDLVALRRFNELNPRFLSVQSPYVSEQQWRYQSPLLPPDVSPRYIGAQVPKSYRDGRFHALLTPAQADSVNRLNLSPRPPAASIPYPLSKQFAKLEQLGASRSPVSPQRAIVPNHSHTSK